MAQLNVALLHTLHPRDVLAPWGKQRAVRRKAQRKPRVYVRPVYVPPTDAERRANRRAVDRECFATWAKTAGPEAVATLRNLKKQLTDSATMGIEDRLDAITRVASEAREYAASESAWMARCTARRRALRRESYRQGHLLPGVPEPPPRGRSEWVRLAAQAYQLFRSLTRPGVYQRHDTRQSPTDCGGVGDIRSRSEEVHHV